VKRALRSALVAVALAIAGAAQAHAFLDHADPRVGATVAKAPAQLRLWFTQDLVSAFCRVSVAGPPGFAGAGPAAPAPGDPRSLVVPLHGPTPPGVYTVRWRVLSVDTHTTEGDFSFRVVGP
jgi:methionine-rich copper-binding protein CopC